MVGSCSALACCCVRRRAPGRPSGMLLNQPPVLDDAQQARGFGHYRPSNRVLKRQAAHVAFGPHDVAQASHEDGGFADLRSVGRDRSARRSATGPTTARSAPPDSVLRLAPQVARERLAVGRSMTKGTVVHTHGGN